MIRVIDNYPKILFLDLASKDFMKFEVFLKNESIYFLIEFTELSKYILNIID